MQSVVVMRKTLMETGNILKHISNFLPLVVLLAASSGPQTALSLQPNREVSPSYNQVLSAPGLKHVTKNL